MLHSSNKTSLNTLVCFSITVCGVSLFKLNLSTHFVIGDHFVHTF